MEMSEDDDGTADTADAPAPEEEVIIGSSSSESEYEDAESGDEDSDEDSDEDDGPSAAEAAEEEILFLYLDVVDCVVNRGNISPEEAGKVIEELAIKLPKLKSMISCRHCQEVLDDEDNYFKSPRCGHHLCSDCSNKMEFDCEHCQMHYSSNQLEDLVVIIGENDEDHDSKSEIMTLILQGYRSLCSVFINSEMWRNVLLEKSKQDVQVFNGVPLAQAIEAGIEPPSSKMSNIAQKANDSIKNKSSTSTSTKTKRSTSPQPSTSTFIPPTTSNQNQTTKKLVPIKITTSSSSSTSINIINTQSNPNPNLNLKKIKIENKPDEHENDGNGSTTKTDNLITNLPIVPPVVPAPVQKYSVKYIRKIPHSQLVRNLTEDQRKKFHQTTFTTTIPAGGLHSTISNMSKSPGVGVSGGPRYVLLDKTKHLSLIKGTKINTSNLISTSLNTTNVDRKSLMSTSGSGGSSDTGSSFRSELSLLSNSSTAYTLSNTIVGSVVQRINTDGIKKLKVRLPNTIKPPSKGCRCGNAATVPGKLTCCGQRCQCYVESKPCSDCRCKGCRNPHLPGGKKLIGINAVLDSSTNSPQTSSSDNPTQFNIINSNTQQLFGRIQSISGSGTTTTFTPIYSALAPPGSMNNFTSFTIPLINVPHHQSDISITNLESHHSNPNSNSNSNQPINGIILSNHDPTIIQQNKSTTNFHHTISTANIPQQQQHQHQQQQQPQIINLIEHQNSYTTS